MKGDLEVLSQASQVIKASCKGIAFSTQQNEQLGKVLSRIDANSKSFFAVRSSSPEEDLEGASFAGGYETTLGVTLENLHEAICHSFASSFDERVFLYKREHGIAAYQPRIAVIVQKQIPADRAGVAFSVNPINNCYDEAVINANFGLGESVVSGIVEPDMFVVDKIDRKILQTHIGAKQTVLSLAPNGGVVNQEQDKTDEVCLRPQQVARITDLMIKIEDVYQHPVDIEWAFHDDELYLLQVRPITTYLPLPEEMITRPGEPKRLYADSTLIEQGLEDPLSVLGTEFLRYVLNTMTGPMGGNADSVDSGAFTAGGRYYMNLSKSLQMAGPLGALAPGSAGDATILAIIENIDTNQYIHEKGSPAEMIKNLAGLLKMIPKMFPVVKALRNPDWILQRYYDALPQQLEQIEEVMHRSLSMDELAKELTGKLDFFFYEFGIPLIFAAQFAQHRINRIFRGDLEQVKEELLSLGAALPGNKTSEMGAAMSVLAGSGVIEKYHSADGFLKELNEGKLDAEFTQRWDDFITEFGARCPREIDVATPRINENQALLFDQLKSISFTHKGAQAASAIFEGAKQKRASAYERLYQLALEKGKKTGQIPGENV